jgi:UDP-glucose 4-epimerase
VLEIYENLCTVMDVSIEPIFAPERIGDPVSLIANIKIAESHLKFRPKKSLKDIVISSLY